MEESGNSRQRAYGIEEARGSAVHFHNFEHFSLAEGVEFKRYSVCKGHGLNHQALQRSFFLIAFHPPPQHIDIGYIFKAYTQLWVAMH